MGLLSYFQRPPDADAPAAVPAAAAPEPDAVAAARARARRRLLGATVLLGLGVIGFPLLFETQPRPIAVDIPIDIPRKDKPPPLAAPAAAPLSRASAALVDGAAPAARAAVERAASAPADIVERASDQGRELVSAPAGAAASRVAAAPASRAPAPSARPAPAEKPPVDDGSRARALLDGQAASAASGSANTPTTGAASAAATRLVVQVGAYTDPTKLADARRKLEAMGLKTYTQVVEGEGGKRTRVRIGPFEGRGEADKVAARVKAAGLPVAILTL